MKKTKFFRVATAVALIAAMAGCDLAIREPYVSKENAVKEWTESLGGSSVSYYKFTVGENGEKYLENVGGKQAIDCNAAQSTVNYDSSANVKWENPLKASDTGNGLTFVFDIYNEASASATFDALLAFCKANDSVYEAFGVFEAGNVRFKYGEGGNDFESIWEANAVSDGWSHETAVVAPGSAKWSKIAVVLGKDSSVGIYKDGALQAGTLIGKNYTYDKLVTFLTTVANQCAVGVGFSGLKASYVDSGCYLGNDIRVYKSALSKAALEDLFGVTVSQKSDTPESKPSGETTTKPEESPNEEKPEVKPGEEQTTTPEVKPGENAGESPVTPPVEKKYLNISLSEEEDGFIGKVSAKLNDIDIESLRDVDAPNGWWNHVGASTVVKVGTGDKLTYVFKGTKVQEKPWHSWNLHFWTIKNDAGNILRADNWIGENLCSNPDPGIWLKGSVTANGEFFNGGNFDSASKCTSENEIKLVVNFDGDNVYVEQYIDNVLKYTTNSTLWKDKE